MSMRALLLAVRDRLRQPVVDGGLAYPAFECEVMVGPEPPPIAGEVFVAIHEGDWRVNKGDADLDETMGVLVTVTVRVGKVPQQMMGLNALVGPAGASLDERSRAIIATLHGDPAPRSASDPSHYPVLALANTTIGAGSNGFVEALRFQGPAGKADLKGPEWFGASGSEGPSQSVGLAQTLAFGGARRVQVIEHQT